MAYQRTDMLRSSNKEIARSRVFPEGCGRPEAFLRRAASTTRIIGVACIALLELPSGVLATHRDPPCETASGENESSSRSDILPSVMGGLIYHRWNYSTNVR